MHMGIAEIGIILILILALVKPEQLKDIARALGRLDKEIKDENSDFNKEIVEPISEVSGSINEVKESVKGSIDKVKGGK